MLDFPPHDAPTLGPTGEVCPDEDPGTIIGAGHIAGVSAWEPDPRWEWVETWTLCSAEPTYLRVRCRHLEVVPVESMAGEVVAHLCLTCDAQLDGGQL